MVEMEVARVCSERKSATAKNRERQAQTHFCLTALKLADPTLQPGHELLLRTPEVGDLSREFVGHGGEGSRGVSDDGPVGLLHRRLAG